MFEKTSTSEMGIKEWLWPKNAEIDGSDTGAASGTCRKEWGWHGYLPLCENTDQKKALDNVLFRVINTEKNARLLDKIPHYNLDWLGLTIVFYLPVHPVIENENAAVMVSNSLMKIWGVTEKELLAHARWNTPSVLRPSITNMSELLKGLAGNKNSDPQSEIYIATNRERLYGAACIFYDGLLERIAKKIGTSFYALPSSIHEMILVPADSKDEDSAWELKRIVMEINRSDAVSPEDFLSDEVYFYDQKKCVFYVAN